MKQKQNICNGSTGLIREKIARSVQAGSIEPLAKFGTSYAMLPAYGRNLVEVFSVRPEAVGGAARPPPCGTVNVFDGRRGQIIYSHSQGGEQRQQPTPITHSSSHAQDDDGLLLTGPYRAISADGSVAIELDLHDPSSQELAPASSHEAAAAARVGFISWDVYDPSWEYDKPISRTVDTRHGPVEVTLRGAEQRRRSHGGGRARTSTRGRRRIRRWSRPCPWQDHRA